MKRTPSVISLVVWSFAVLAGPAAYGGAVFQGLGDLPGYDFYSFASGVSGDGSVVVGISNSAASGIEGEAFRWTQGGGMSGLGFLPGDSGSWATDASYDGSVVTGTSTLGGLSQGYSWTQATGMVGVGHLPGHLYSFGNAISADGSFVVGSSEDDSAREAYRWTQAGGMVGLGDLPGGPPVSFSVANGVSGDGSVVVGVGTTDFGPEAFRWTEGSGMVGLGSLPGGPPISFAYDVSADGTAVVGRAFNNEAFIWTESAGMIGLGIPAGFRKSHPMGVSGDGSVVVGLLETLTYQTEAFLWNETDGMRGLKGVLEGDYGLDLTGWTLRIAYGVSDDGLTIVGDGISPAGNHEAWMATIPEPATAALLTIGLSILVRRWRGYR